ncbi:hypothetical protein DOT_4507 [Desulfosporosinus sp. OT]|nr:hypothetical protein DOT_4507 [Desulfosporosinus sp. OT]
MQVFDYISIIYGFNLNLLVFLIEIGNVTPTALPVQAHFPPVHTVNEGFPLQGVPSE